MRKVTASAVILTAITGCSQSEVPSSNWSFDAPAGQQLAGLKTAGDAGQSNVFDSDSQGLLNQTSRPFTGPSLGQSDDANALKLDALADSAALAPAPDLLTQGASPDIAAVVSTRIDPLASVRSYLDATSSVSGISNRVPYSSQVYLPDAPVYSPTVVSAQEVAALPSLQAPSFPSAVAVDASLAVADFAQASVSAFPVQPEFDVATVPVNLPPLPPAASDARSEGFLSASTASAPQSFISTETISPAEGRFVSESYIEENGVQSTQSVAVQDTLPVQSPLPVQDTLPVLEPASLERRLFSSDTFSSDIAASDIFSSETASLDTLESSVSEPVSVGTAILQTLAQDGDQEALATLAAADTESGSIEISVEEALPQAATVAAEQRPTLSGLLASMPRRDEAPIVNSFEVVPRDVQSLSRLSDEGVEPDSISEPVLVVPPAVPSGAPIPAFMPQPLAVPLPAGLLREAPAETSAAPVSVESGLVESVSTESVSTESLRSEASPPLDVPISDADYRLRPEGYSSPLLESLALAEQQSTVALSAVYVPIPELPDTDLPASLIREAIASLGDETNRLGSVASVQTLEDPTATLVRFGEPSRSIRMAVEDSAAQKYDHLRKLPSRSASRSQAVRQRQRIVWP